MDRKQIWNVKNACVQALPLMVLDISETAQDRLLAYVDLLKKWNKTYNLTALRDEEKMIVHHLLDSLTLLPYIEGAQTMLDVGSGGLPARHSGAWCAVRMCR